jgi:hypothetical protein
LKPKENPDSGLHRATAAADRQPLNHRKIHSSRRVLASVTACWSLAFERSAAAVARWSPESGFSFGFNQFVTGTATCAGAPPRPGQEGGKCLQYPGDEAITGKVDRKAGTITLDVPASKLRALRGGEGPGQRPAQVPAQPGDRLYDGTAFSLTDASPTGGRDQSFLYPLDNAPAMDFRIPTASASGGNGNGGRRGGFALPPGAGSCTSGLAGVHVRPRGRGAQIAFRRRSGTGRVRVDVYQESRGRTVYKRGRRMAHFSRTRGFTWNGRANQRGRRVGDGILFVRMKARTARHPAGIVIRRYALRRTHGRLHSRPGFARHPRCSGLIRYFALTRPVMGGPRHRNVRAVVQSGSRARVTITARRHGRVVRRFRADVAAGEILRRTVRSRGIGRGDVRVTATVRSGSRKRSATRTVLSF